MNCDKNMVDTIIDIHKENSIQLCNIFKVFDNILCILNDMKKTTIKFEQEIVNLTKDSNELFKENLIMDFYNSGLEHFIKELQIFTKIKVQSLSGIGTFVIKNSNVHLGFITEPYHTYTLTLKLPDYNWLNNIPLCLVDNMSIDPENNKCSCDYINIIITIYIGENKYNILKTESLMVYNVFYNTIIVHNIKVIHNLIANFNKNILLIEKSIEYLQNFKYIYKL
jgi:hypothetical protein